MHLAIIGIVFVVIFLGELPDKSLFASLVLGSRFPAWYVWLGAASAFLVHVIIAVTAGKLLTLLPHNVLEIVIASLFLGGALLLFFGKHGVSDEENGTARSKLTKDHSFRKVYATSFMVIFLGEWGDITQIATANYAAKYHDTVNVAIGATLGLWTVTALAIIAGTKALSLVPAKVLRLVTGSVLLIFAVISIVSAFK
ncbi:MAG: TMEM165/GDT1 family protein [Candidatus Saccharimonadales bacterium]